MQLEKIMLSDKTQTRKTNFVYSLLLEALSSKYLDMTMHPGVTAESRKVKKKKKDHQRRINNKKVSEKVTRNHAINDLPKNTCNTCKPVCKNTYVIKIKFSHLV